jgi:hypothetical protein
MSWLSRRGTDSAATFVTAPDVEQRGWAEDLAGRLQVPRDGYRAICILDSGVTRLHSLISPLLLAQGVHRYDPDWPEGQRSLPRSWHEDGRTRIVRLHSSLDSDSDVSQAGIGQHS